MAPPRKKGSKGASAAASRHVWNIGDLVLAKVKGHPWWPARVSEPDEFGYTLDRRKVFVYFFGTKQIGFVQPADVKSFTSETKKSLLAKLQVKNSSTDFSRAVKEICEASKGFNGHNDDDSQASLNEASDTANEEALEQEEVDEVEENTSNASVSRGQKRNSDGLKGPSPECQERETRSRAQLGNGVEFRQSAEKVNICATYEPNKKRRRLLAGKEDTYRNPAVSNAKNAPPPRRLSSRHARTSEASLSVTPADHTEIPDQMFIDDHTTVEAEISVDHKKEGDLERYHDQPAQCLSDDGAGSKMHLDKITSFHGKHLQASPCDSHGVSSRDATNETRQDSPRTFPVQNTDKTETDGTETVSEADDAPQQPLKPKTEDTVPQTLLPKKKRRASRKLERDTESITALETDEQLPSVSLQPPELEGFAKSLPSEYQRRKRVFQSAGNDLKHDGAVVKEEGSSVINTDVSSLLEVPPLADSAPEQSEPLEASRTRELPQLEERAHIHTSWGNVSEGDVRAGEDKVVDTVYVETNSKAGNFQGEPALDNQDGGAPASAVKLSVGSRPTAERDTSLPPKADKYRIRSSIADGEAALPPSKRRQRALEAMSACAAEAAAVESTTKLEQQIDLAATVSSGQEDEKKVEKSQRQAQSSPQNASRRLQDFDSNTQSVLSEHLSQPVLHSIEEVEKPAELSVSSECDIVALETRENIANGGLPPKKDVDMTTLSPRKGESGKSKQQKVANQGKTFEGARVGTDLKSKVKAKSLSTSDGNPEKAGHDIAVKHLAKQTRGSGLSKMPLETKAGFKELIRANNSSEKSRSEMLGAFRMQAESNINKVRAAVEAAKEAQLKRQAMYTKADFSNDFEASPSPGSSLLNSPAHHSLAASLGMDSRDMYSTVGRDSTTGSETFKTLGEESRISPSRSLGSKEANLAGDTEAAVARDTFEGMLETLSRTKESIARATRHALECAKFGIVDEVLDIIVRKLENEPSFHRRIDLFFLVDSITQVSVSTQGVGAAYPQVVQAMLPRLLQAAAPAGSVARENRRQCLKVLKLWSARKVMPESVLKSHVNDLESHNDDRISGVSLRRPARFERAVDDPIREMEGMFVDEYGSNATFGLTGLLSSRMFEDDEEGSGGVNLSEQKLQSSAYEAEDLPDECPVSVKKRRHILEDVEGELEMEDASPEGAMRSYGYPGGFPSPPLPAEPPPPPPPDSPPPSPPPLPKSPPPPPPSPPPPPPMSPPPPPPPPLPLPLPPQQQQPASPPLNSYMSPFLHSYGSASFASIPSSQLSPIVTHPGVGPGYSVCKEPQTVLSLAGAHPLQGVTNDDKSYEHPRQQHFTSQNIQQTASPCGTQSFNNEAAYSSPTRFMMSNSSQSFNSSMHPSYNGSQVQVSHHGVSYTQTKFSRLPSPPPLPPRLPRYGNSRAIHQSSPAPFERERNPLHSRRGEYEHRHVNSDHGRGRFEDGYMPSHYTGQAASQDDNSYHRKYSSHDSRPRPGYVRGASSHSSGIPSQAGLGTPANAGSAEMPNALYTGHAAGMSGGLMHDVSTDQAKVEVLGRQRSSTSKWGPS